METKTTSEKTERVAVMNIGQFEFAIAVKDVQEMLNVERTIDVPLAPPFINKIMSRRGRIITIFDLSFFFFSKKTTIDEEARIILLYNKEMNIGLLAKRIVQIEFINKINIEQLTDIEKDSKEYLFSKGVLRSEYTDREVNILDSEKILQFCSDMSFNNG